jgi:hypothetical protein
MPRLNTSSDSGPIFCDKPRRLPLDQRHETDCLSVSPPRYTAATPHIDRLPCRPPLPALAAHLGYLLSCGRLSLTPPAQPRSCNFT